MRTELSDGTITIRAYELGIEQALFEAADESVREIGPSMRTWSDGATHERAARHVAESIQAWHAGTWYDFAIAVDNLASLRVAEKVGATFEGVLPAGPHGHGELQNQCYCFSLIARKDRAAS